MFIRLFNGKFVKCFPIIKHTVLSSGAIHLKLKINKPSDVCAMTCQAPAAHKMSPFVLIPSAVISLAYYKLSYEFVPKNVTSPTGRA